MQYFTTSIQFEHDWNISSSIFWWDLLHMLIVYHFSLQCIVLCFWILRISMLWVIFFNFLHVHVFANSDECMFYLCVKLFIYTKFHVYTAIYCCYNYLSTVQKWNFTSYDKISDSVKTGCEKIFTYLSELLCMWPAIFLIDPDALIIPRTWYVLIECFKVCHI